MIEVVANLLRQFISQLSSLPKEIGKAYNSLILKSERFSLRNLIDPLLFYSKEFYTFIVLDSLDECSDDYQREIVAVVGELHKMSGCRILISSRHHVQCLRSGLNNKTTVEISADEADLVEISIKHLDTLIHCLILYFLSEIINCN